MKKHFPYILSLFSLVLTIVMFMNCSFGKKPHDKSHIRVLLVTGGHEFEEAPFYEMLNSIPDISFTEVKHPNALYMLKQENRSNYDVILLYDMPHINTDQEKTDFINCIKEGKGLVVLHHAFCAYHDWQEYHNIVGGKFHREIWTDDKGAEHPTSTYKHDVTFRVNVIDSKHPVTKGIEDFDIVDETYNLCSVYDDVHPIVSTNEPTSVSTIAWTKQYGNARIVTLLLGHDNQAWSNPSFKKLLSQSLIWVNKKE